MISIEYTKYINTYDPIAASWMFNEKKIEIEFKEPISALPSEPMGNVVIEIYGDRKLNFYSLNGELLFSESLPTLNEYQFRGINKSQKSESGISLLFHPVADSAGNKWNDTEQFELLNTPGKRLGRNLGIYR